MGRSDPLTVADRCLLRLLDGLSSIAAGDTVTDGYRPSPLASSMPAMTDALSWAWDDWDGERCKGVRNACVSEGCGDGPLEAAAAPVLCTGGCDALWNDGRGGECGGERVDGWCADAVLHHAGVLDVGPDAGGRNGSAVVIGAERVGASVGREVPGATDSEGA